MLPGNKVRRYCQEHERDYDYKVPRKVFVPNGKSSIEMSTNETYENLETYQSIPSISRQIDSSFRQKFTSYEMRPNEINRRRLRKSLKGFGCVVNYALTDGPIKKLTQIQACSISVMIVAIVVICFVLVNSTSPSFTQTTNVASTIVVPTKDINLSNNSSPTEIVVQDYVSPLTEINKSTEAPVNKKESNHVAKNIVHKLISNLMKVYLYVGSIFNKSNQTEHLPKRHVLVNSTGALETFCLCQTNEICMLEEETGTSICKQAVDMTDPTGCGGLCAMVTEACQLVDKARGVRTCRQLQTLGRPCSPQEWRCHNGLCVPADFRCDGLMQCYDRSDEMYCECDLSKQFQCGHNLSCFSNIKLCNGIVDCWDGTDEVNCFFSNCTEHQFPCSESHCIPNSYFCDGRADCKDGSDEPVGCGLCQRHEMRCDNGRCVPRTVVCDRHDDCGDGSDERTCLDPHKQNRSKTIISQGTM